jgi:hypothetical protein
MIGEKLGIDLFAAAETLFEPVPEANAFLA